ncbi:MAG: glycerate kinase [Eubacteriales bacterium]|nr:glycerate kinase [Eubacteriales bacterium]
MEEYKPKFVFASDAFKGTLSAEQTAALLGEAAKKMFPDCICLSAPVADGGEGTVQAVIRATGGSLVPVRVHDPYMEEIDSFYGKIDEQHAIVAAADASGLCLLPHDRRNPFFTTSYGTGELIRAALDAGFRDISIAAGGCAANDGGMGCLTALGVRFLNKQGEALRGIGANLREVNSIDKSGLHPAVKDCHFTVLCDVEAPLCGPEGTTRSFGKKKGGTRQMLDELERGMENYAAVLDQSFMPDQRSGGTPGTSVRELEGGGAAGGLAAALCCMLGAKLKKGVDAVLDLTGFDETIRDADCVITGEGKADRTSVYGKVMSGVGRRSHAQGIPVFAIVGSIGPGADDIYACGVDSMITTIDRAMPIEEALEQAESLYRNAADRLMRILRVGYDVCIQHISAHKAG